MNRTPGSLLLKSSLPGSALRTHVEWLGKPRDVNKRLINLISKDTHLVFSISQTIWNQINMLPKFIVFASMIKYYEDKSKYAMKLTCVIVILAFYRVPTEIALKLLSNRKLQFF